jgi:hypothetical protein
MLQGAVGISLLKPDGMLHTVAVHHPIPDAERLLQQLMAGAPIRLGEGITGTVAKDGVSQLIPEVDPEQMAARSAPAYRSFLERYPVHGFICAPLRSRGRIIGTVTLTRAEPGLPPYTRADVALIANAGQHGAKGSDIVIRLDGSAEHEVRLQIHNDGAIPPALLPTIFDPFRTSRHRGAASAGLGLGLFIVREIVRAHGGTVTVASSEDSGTTFTLTVPRTARPPRDARPRHAAN